MKIILEGNPVSKKNSQRILRLGNGRTIIAPSKQFKEYEKKCGEYIPITKEPINHPVEVTCHFYMGTKRRVDLTNLLEAADDILVTYGVLADDNSNIIVSHDGSRVYYDKEYPRTEIYIEEVIPW